MWTISCLRITLLLIASLTSGERQGTSILGTYMDGTQSTRTFLLVSGPKWLRFMNLLRYVKAGFPFMDVCILLFRKAVCKALFRLSRFLCHSFVHLLSCCTCIRAMSLHIHSIYFLNYWRVRSRPLYCIVLLSKNGIFSDITSTFSNLSTLDKYQYSILV
jgi:hypothetical protein